MTPTVIRGPALADGDEILVSPGACLRFGEIEVRLSASWGNRGAEREYHSRLSWCYAPDIDGRKRWIVRREPPVRFVYVAEGAVVPWETVARLARIGEDLPVVTT